jgi:hypothetical protein
MKKMYLYTMEFHSTTKKNEILSFMGKWMEPEIILSEVRPKIACSPSYEDHGLKTNAAILLVTGHTVRGDHTREG